MTQHGQRAAQRQQQQEKATPPPGGRLPGVISIFSHWPEDRQEFGEANRFISLPAGGESFTVGPL